MSEDCYVKYSVACLVFTIILSGCTNYAYYIGNDHGKPDVGESGKVTEVEKADDAVAVNIIAVDEEMTVNDAGASKASSPMASVLRDSSLGFFETERKFADHQEMDVVEFMYSNVSSSQGAVNIDSYLYDTDTNVFVAKNQRSDDNEQICVLDNNRWRCVDGAEVITLENSYIKILKGGLAITERRIEGTKNSLSGLKVNAVVNDEWKEVLDPLSVFGIDATSYRLSFSQVNDYYAFRNERKTTINGCGFQEATDILCNNVVVRTTGTDDIIVAKSFSQLFTLPEIEVVDSAIVPVLKGIDLSIGGISNLMVLNAVSENATSGSTDVHEIYHNETGEQRKLLGHGQWSILLVQGKSILTYQLPVSLSYYLQDDRDPVIVSYAEDDSSAYLRRGSFFRAGKNNMSNPVFNAIAKDKILASFDLSLLTAMSPCVTDDSAESPETRETIENTSEKFNLAVNTCLFETGLSAMPFTSVADVLNKTLITDFGYLKFETPTTGMFYGGMDDGKEGWFDFEWSFDDTNKYVNISARMKSINAEGVSETEFVSLTIARIQGNAKETSFKVFSKEADSLNVLASNVGEIKAEVWQLN